MHQIDLDPSVLALWRGPTAQGIIASRTALVVLDLQAGFIDEGFPGRVSGVLDIIPNVNRLVRAFRDAGARVVFTRHTIIDEQPYAPPPWQMTDETFRPVWETLRPGSAGHALHESLDVEPRDRVIDKYKYSAFIPHSCDLDRELRLGGVDTIIIVGAVTNVCCDSSARDANMLNYEVIVVADATATSDDAAHNNSLAGIALCFGLVKFTQQVIDKIIF